MTTHCKVGRNRTSCFPMRLTPQFELFNDRQRHALDAQRNLAVRAGAGSGKTSVLVERIVQLLDKRRTDLEPLRITQIVAITFTRKAALHLQDKLREQFVRLAKESADAAERAFWKDCIERLPRAEIGTIDSLCGRILREFGLHDDEKPIEPDFAALADADVASLRTEAIDRVVNRLTELVSPSPPTPLPEGEGRVLQDQATACRWWALAEGYFVLYRHLKQLLNSVVEPATIIKAHEGLPPVEERVSLSFTKEPAIAELRRGAPKLVVQLRELADVIQGMKKPNQKLLSVVDAVPTLIRDIGKPNRTRVEDLELVARLKEQFMTKGGDPWKQGFEKFQDESSLIADIQNEWVPRLANLNFDFDAEVRALDAADKLVCLFRPVYEEYLMLCQERGRYDFQTVARRTRDLLHAQQHVQKQLHERWRYVLVDEFQDTNQLQWEIVAHLAGTGPDGMLDRDRLFIVGDPQQSIYRFRDADVSVFSRIQERIVQANLQHELGDRLTDYDEHLDLLARCASKGIASENTVAPCLRVGLTDREGTGSTDTQRLGVMPLKENYRSLNPMPLGLMNDVYRFVFDVVRHGHDPKEYPFEVEYQDLEPGVTSKACGEVTYVIPALQEDTAENGDDDNAVSELAEGEPTKEDLGMQQVAIVVDQLMKLHGQAKADDSKTFDWKDMAVLMPSRHVVLNNLEKEFLRRGVPYIVTSGVGFWQRQEIRDVVSLASWLADTGDELALFAVLRSPLGQLTDNEVLFLSELGRGRLSRGLRLLAQLDEELQSIQSHKPATASVTRPGFLPFTDLWPSSPPERGDGGEGEPTDAENADDAVWINTNLGKLSTEMHEGLRKVWTSFASEVQQRVRTLVDRLRHWQRRVDRMTHSDLLQRALEESSAYAIYAAESDGEMMLLNLQRLFGIIRSEEASAAPGLSFLARWLRDQVDEALRQEQAAPPNDRDAVQVMTVHAAKGLEFPVVAVMRMERKLDNLGGASSLLVKKPLDSLLPLDKERFPDVAAGTIVVSVRHPKEPRVFYKSRLHEALQELDNVQELAEARRLFYVAGTRAKERLILAGQEKKQKSGNSWQSWFEEALTITPEDKVNGEWKSEPFAVKIITKPPVAADAPPPAEQPITADINLEYLHELPLAPTIATTAFEKMLETWTKDRREWWLSYRHQVLTHMPELPATFPVVTSDALDKTVSMAIGTIVHRMFEANLADSNLTAEARRALLEAMAVNLLAEDSGKLDDSTTPPASVAAVRRIVAATEGVLQKLNGTSEGAKAVRALLQAPGEAEVPFILQLASWHISGRYDKLLRYGDTYEIVDWKTDAGKLDDLLETYRPQMRLYALALYRTGKHKLVDGKILVRLALLHFPQVATLEFTVKELDNFARQTEKTLKEMDDFMPE